MQNNNQAPTHVFEPIQALVVPSGYVHQQPMDPVHSVNQQAYGMYSNARGINSRAMNKHDFASGMQPRSREARLQMAGQNQAALQNDEFLNQLRAREDIRGYHKFVDNAKLNHPDPKSSHFAAPLDRHNKDFAQADRDQREQERMIKQQKIESRRMQQMNRDIKRWEFMEYQDSTLEQRNEKMRQKYKLGQKGNGSAAYNPVNMEYESSPQGQKMKSLEQSRSQRAIVRGRNIEQASQPMFNPINGSARQNVLPNLNLSEPVSRMGQPGIDQGPSGGIQSAGRPIRSIASRIEPGQFLSPNDVPIYGKKVYPSHGTVNQYIPEEQAQAAWMKTGKRIEVPLQVRAGSPSQILKPNAVINQNPNRISQVAIGPNGSSSMPNQLSSQLNNEMKNLINVGGNDVQPPQASRQDYQTHQPGMPPPPGYQQTIDPAVFQVPQLPMPPLNASHNRQQSQFVSGTVIQNGPRGQIPEIPSRNAYQANTSAHASQPYMPSHMANQVGQPSAQSSSAQRAWSLGGAGTKFY